MVKIFLVAGYIRGFTVLSWNINYFLMYVSRKHGITEKLKIVPGYLFFSSCFFLFAQNPKLVLPIGHTSLVVSAIYSPDGKYIVTASWDNTAMVWQAADGRLLYTLKGHTGSVTSATFSPDGKYIVTSSKDNTARIWKAGNGELMYQLKGHRDWVTVASFSPDGKYVLTASWDSTAKLWDAGTGKLVYDLKGHDAPLSAATFSANGTMIITGSRNGMARIWKTMDGRLSHQLKGHTGAVNAAKFSPDGKYVITASEDGTAKTWDASDGKLLFNIKAHNAAVNDAVFSADGKYIVTCSSDSTAKVWLAADGTLLHELKGHQGPLKSVVYDRECRHILTSSTDNTAKIWDPLNGKLLHSLQGHSNWVNTAVFSPDGKFIVTSSSDNTAKIWRAAGGKWMHDLKGHVSMASFAAFSPDGKYIVAVSPDSTLKLWNARDGHLIKTLNRHTNWMSSTTFSPNGKYFLASSFDNTAGIYELPGGQLLHELKGHTDWISSAVFSEDGKYIVTTSWDSTARIWNALNGSLLHNLHAHTNIVQSASFSRSGKYIVTASWDNTAKIWNVADGRLLFDLRGHRDKVRSAMYSNDGKYVLTASWDSTARIWNATDGRLLHVLKGHKGFVNSALFSPDGKYVATVSMDGTARTWSSLDGHLVHIFKGHQKPVISASFSTSGKIMYTSSWDNTAKIWNAGDGHLLHSLESHTAPLNSISVSSDEKYILTSSGDNTLKKWNTQTGELLYTFFAVDSADYLALDKDGRYDGTETARKMLYYACDNEVLDLEQFKGLAWEPGLVSKQNGINKEPVSAKKISEIDICNYTPIVEEKEGGDSNYHFQIIPRNGGISEAQLYVNNKLIKTYALSDLQKNSGSYFVTVARDEVSNYFVSDGDNQVLVKALTANGVMQSRGTYFTVTTEIKMRPPPNMYVLTVGISSYKPEDMKLNYASKDAMDFSSALIASAQKLLNTDGRQHVIAYTFNTETNSMRWPLKKEIEKAIDTIIQKAMPDDILVAFFAGHGMLPAGQKIFYVLTAEAPGFDVAGIEKDVAISTDELDEWSRKIKANKQVLILDACSSGQVINNLRQVSDRGNVPADQQRALENLKDKTGIFILSASASGQAARESSLYNQGLLTYSLLSGIKLGGGLKDNKFIDVSKWFNFVSDDVSKMAKEAGLRQQPQILGNASFDVGIVDKQITDSIKLSLRKKIFHRSNFIEDEELISDDIGFSALVDRELNNLSEKGRESPLIFTGDNTFDSAYSVRGKYSVTGNAISASIFLIKGQKEKVYQFDLKGTTDKKEEMAAVIVEKLRKFLFFGDRVAKME